MDTRQVCKGSWTHPAGYIGVFGEKTGHRKTPSVTRAFFFSNMYLNGIQHGIQALHAGIEVAACGPVNKDTAGVLDILHDWVQIDKTAIVLNGGDHEKLGNLIDFLDTPDNPYPWNYFLEPGLNFAITSVVIIVPEHIWGPIVFEAEYTAFDVELIRRKSECSLAI